jgi:hypothetical protein
MAMVIKSPRIAAALVIATGLLAGVSTATGKTLSTVKTPTIIVKISSLKPEIIDQNALSSGVKAPDRQDET